MIPAFLNRWIPWKRRFGAESSRFAGYHIVRVVHEGEKAFVYQARSPLDGALYAIKAYKPEYNRTARKLRRRYSLRSEGDYGRMLNPPPGADTTEYPIVRTVSDSWEFEDPSREYFVVLEFIDGINLKHMIGCAHPSLASLRYEIASSVIRALGIIHGRGLVHRDVCADNVIVAREGRAKLIDLGFVAPIGLKFHEKTGTLSYMSPEQFQGRPLNPASDIYSYGVLLFELFTGQLPYRTTISSADSSRLMMRAGDMMKRHLYGMPPDPREITPDIPEPLAKLILKCIRKSPDQRPSGTRQIMATLASICEKPAAESPAEAAPT